jgi:hypothetical protein
VTYRPTDRQHPQHTRGQQYRSSVFCGPRTDCCYTMHDRRILACAVTPHNKSHADRCFLWVGVEAVFSELRGPCRVYAREPVWRNNGAEPRERGYSGVQRSTTGTRELELGVSRESSFGIRRS